MSVSACPKWVIVFLFMATSVLSGFTHAQDLKSVLPSVCAQSGSFTQKSFIVGIDQPLLSSGKFIFGCQHGLVWVQNEPISEAVAYSLKGKVFLERNEHVETLRQRHHKEMGRLLNNIFSSNDTYLEKKFAVAALESGQSKLVLKPKSARYKKVFSSLFLEKTDTEVLLTIVLKNGERRELQLGGLEELSTTSKQDCVSFIEPFHLVCSELFN